MASKEDIRKRLDVDELDYLELANELGPSVVPVLHELVSEDDQRVAPRAAYLASLFDTDDAAKVVAKAAQSRHDATRVAAASALSNAVAAKVESQVYIDLLRDHDPGVRVKSINAATLRNDTAINVRLNEVMNVDPVEEIRSITAKALNARKK
jgi:HEAT repeat protein